MTENELLEHARQGDQRAFKSLVECFEQPIATVVKGILGDCAEAEDVGQEVFIRFYKSMHQFNGKSTLKTYLTCIAINCSLNELKKKKLTFSINNVELQNGLMIKQAGNSNYENQELIDKALNLLPHRQRSIVVLRLMQGYSVKETAKILQIPAGTVLSRLSRATETLKKILKPIITVML
jgi:RNA polymerase sigma-70 factor (ECF subfamily)